MAKIEQTKNPCRHRWTRYAVTGAAAMSGRGELLIIERCDYCREGNSRKATSAERREHRARCIRDQGRSREFHRAWLHVRKLLERYRDCAEQDGKLEFGRRMERLQRRFQDRIKYVHVDDAVHANSDLWLVLHYCDDPRWGFEYWGTSAIYVGQCDAMPLSEFFFYPRDMKMMLKAAKEIEALQRKLNRGRRW